MPDASSPEHRAVLAAETLALLDPRPGETALDLTAGCGGHSAALADRVGPRGLVIGFDVDPEALVRAAARVRAEGGVFEAVHANFIEAPRHLEATGRHADVVLGDLGFSSAQMDDPGRGFSFRLDGPLDMRYDRGRGASAEELLARLSEPELAELIARYGEDPFARRIARKLGQARGREPIRSTAQLARLVVEAYGPRARSSRMHPATRTFMALRIAVNEELTALGTLLEHVQRGAATAGRSGWLSRGARMAIISFHSLEDRMVKRAFADLAACGLASRLTKRPVVAGEDEVRSNPRSRSARLRAVRVDGRPPSA